MSSSNPFSLAKKVFAEKNDKIEYIRLDSSGGLLDHIHQAILHQPFSLMLIYGPPGVGKSFLLQRLFVTLRKEVPLYFFRVPFGHFGEFMEKIYEEFLKESYDSSLSHQAAIEQFLQKFPQEFAVIFLDEVQLYGETSLEYIRLLSDTGKFKFVLAMHRLKNEDLLAQEYFSSRIWDTIKIAPLSRAETQTYIEKRLLQYSLDDLVRRFDKKSNTLLHKLSNGNFRNINKLLYKMFDIYEYYDTHKPSKITGGTIHPQIIEMAALDLGLLRA